MHRWSVLDRSWPATNCTPRAGSIFAPCLLVGEWPIRPEQLLFNFRRAVTAETCLRSRWLQDGCARSWPLLPVAVEVAWWQGSLLCTVESAGFARGVLLPAMETTRVRSRDTVVCRTEGSRHRTMVPKRRWSCPWWPCLLQLARSCSRERRGP